MTETALDNSAHLYSCLSASTGSILAALHAGYRPKITLITIPKMSELMNSEISKTGLIEISPKTVL
jgi:hypothetical protein